MVTWIVEYEKGVVANKVLGFPTVIHLQNRTEVTNKLKWYSNKYFSKLQLESTCFSFSLSSYSVFLFFILSVWLIQSSLVLEPPFKKWR